MLHSRRAPDPAPPPPELLDQRALSPALQTRTIGRVEVSEKPEMIWDHPELDRLYERLAAEYELIERDHALTRKLELIANVTGTYPELLNNRRSLRVG